MDAKTKILKLLIADIKKRGKKVVDPYLGFGTNYGMKMCYWVERAEERPALLYGEKKNTTYCRVVKYEKNGGWKFQSQDFQINDKELQFLLRLILPTISDRSNYE